MTWRTKLDILASRLSAGGEPALAVTCGGLFARIPFQSMGPNPEVIGKRVGVENLFSDIWSRDRRRTEYDPDRIITVNVA